MTSPNNDPFSGFHDISESGPRGLGIAPDLRRMLAVLASGIEALESADDRRGVDLRSGMQRAMINAVRLTNELAMLESRQAQNMERVSLAPHIGRIVQMMRRHLPDEAEISFDIPAGVWPIYANPDDIEGAIMAVIRNAAEAIEPGGHVSIKASNMPSSGTVQIEVSDDGCGIEPAALDLILQPFYSTKLSSRHPGLGLTRAMRFAHRSGGRIQVQSRPGSGSRVIIEMPRANGAKADFIPRIGFMDHGSSR